MAHRGCVNDGQLRAGHTVHRRGTVWCLDLQYKISSHIHTFSTGFRVPFPLAVCLTSSPLLAVGGPPAARGFSG
jgi:hypothetical protein